MNIFMTGATGYIGGTIARRLLDEGHTLRGLVRDEEKSKKLAAFGVEPVIGGLDDAAILTAEARRADAVINTANSDHRGAVEAFLEGLAGSNKPFIHTSGSSIVPTMPTATSPRTKSTTRTHRSIRWPARRRGSRSTGRFAARANAACVRSWCVPP